MNLKEMSRNRLFYTILTFNAVTGNERLHTSTELHVEYHRRFQELEKKVEEGEKAKELMGKIKKLFFFPGTFGMPDSNEETIHLYAPEQVIRKIQKLLKDDYQNKDK